MWLLAPPAQAADLLQRGILERRQGRFVESILSFQSLLKTEPDHVRAWYELGLSYATDGQYGKAADAYRLALSHGFAEASCHCALALALRETHSPVPALSEAKRCLELLPNYAGAWNLIGNVEMDLGHLDKARDAYQNAVTLKPAYANAHFNLGLACVELRRDQEAERAFSEAVRLQSTLPLGWTLLGDCQARQGRSQDALKSYEQALRVNPQETQAHWGLAKVWRGLGDIQKAKSHEQSYRRLTREADNRSYFEKSDKSRRAAALESEAWDKEAHEHPR